MPIIEFLNQVNPGPLFVAALIPYICFLYWAQKSQAIPLISLWGYRLTLLFVFMTIVFAIVSQIYFGEELTNVDPLHGAAEAFLTLSDALILFGFYQFLREKEVKNS